MCDNSLTLANGGGMVPMPVLSISDAIKRRKDFDEYVDKCMDKGEDYGVITGTEKPTLLKPGAEKLLSLFGLTSRMETIEKVEDWENGFFFYKHRCSAIWPRRMEDGSIREEIIFEGIGSCNSMESKYAGRWLTFEALSKEQQEEALAGRLKTETRGEWVVEFAIKDLDDATVKAFQEMQKLPKAQQWQTKKFTAKSGVEYTKYLVPNMKLYQVKNERVYDQVNTIEKMSQKRALVCAALGATSSSGRFTQDVEDQAKMELSGKDDVIDAEVVDEKPKANPKPSKGAAAPKAAPSRPMPEDAETKEPAMTAEDTASTKEKMTTATTSAKLNAIVHALPQSWRTKDIMEHYGNCLKSIAKKVPA